ncbi:DUF4926 domain-containing protein [Spirosoma fluminis]
MMNERDLVALLIDLPEAGLFRGDVGTVAFVHGNQKKDLRSSLYMQAVAQLQ